MINSSTNRGKWILKPTIPSGTELIDYNVYVNDTLTFVGHTKYFGGDYEVDMSDYIETKILAGSSSVSLRVVFTFDNGSSTTTQVLSWTPESISITPINTSSTDAYIELFNSGYVINSSTVKVPLNVYNGYIVGKTVNNLEKITYIDRYSDTHNGGMTNKYELECYIDPCWLQVTTDDDYVYEQLMMALQYAGKAELHLGSGIGIKGLSAWSTTIEGRVKDIEKIELYSQYSTSKRVPSLKIIFEIYK